MVASSPAGRELLVRGQLVEGEHLGRQPGLVDALLPVLAQLRRADHERVDVPRSSAYLLDEREPDLGLAGADAVGVDDAAVSREDAPRPLVAVALERSQRVASDLPGFGLIRSSSP